MEGGEERPCITGWTGKNSSCARRCAPSPCWRSPRTPFRRQRDRCCLARPCGRWRRVRRGRSMARCSNCGGRLRRRGWRCWPQRWPGWWRWGRVLPPWVRRSLSPDGCRGRRWFSRDMRCSFLRPCGCCWRRSPRPGKQGNSVSRCPVLRRCGWGRCFWRAGCRGMYASIPAR